MVGLPEIRVERGLSEECGWVVHGLGLPKVHVRGLHIHFFFVVYCSAAVAAFKLLVCVRLACCGTGRQSRWALCGAPKSIPS